LGYIGTGMDADSLRSDFWEFDLNVNGINEVGLANLISVYPNPFSDPTTLQSDIILKTQPFQCITHWNKS
jgi:hypothetical protein